MSSDPMRLDRERQPRPDFRIWQVGRIDSRPVLDRVVLHRDTLPEQDQPASLPLRQGDASREDWR
jgi:hypothetical protein